MTTNKTDLPLAPGQSKADKNVEALKKLRAMPRGSQVETRIAGIQSMLGAQEIFKTLQSLRWPQGILCPRCHSTQVVKRRPPDDNQDERAFYECMHCKEQGNPSDFDDLTGLPIGDIVSLRQWILCWYLIGFCSIAQVAKVLGTTMSQVMQMAEFAARITEVNPKLAEKLENQFFGKQPPEQKNVAQRKQQVAEDELKTRSRSLGKFKPGPKSSN